MSEGDGGTYQPVDQNAIDAMRVMPGPAGFMGNAMNLMTRAADKAALAASQAAGGSMRIDPDQVQKLAQFFRDEAQALTDRLGDVQELALINAPGDPVSSNATTVFSSVASGGGSGYAENYTALIEIFADQAEKLEQSVQQVRLDDQNAADGMSGGNVAS
ncbi:hypothetical protein ABT337_01920 [Saccharopolyspora hirsuta]|uniref:hypothetical protein n=1 Tax=Saccharopolyspora hirsuta TaxID=1837 RepID=UPI003324429A